MVGCIYGSLTSVVIGWLGSYPLWLAQGCRPFTPYVSDLAGGSSRWLFLAGLTSSSLFLFPCWFDHHLAAKGLLEDGAPRKFQWLCTFLPILGVWCSLSILGVALNPWDRRMSLHLVAANGIFVGGPLWVFLGTLIGRRRGASFKKLWGLVLTAGISMMMMSVFVARGWHQRKMSNDASMRQMRFEYEAYCSGQKGSPHGNINVNIAAAFEWVLLASVIALILGKLLQDLHSWPYSFDGRGILNAASFREAGVSLPPA